MMPSPLPATDCCPTCGQVLSTQQRVQQYHEQGLSPPEIAVQVELSLRRVRQVLHQLGLAAPQGRPRKPTS